MTTKSNQKGRITKHKPL